MNEIQTAKVKIHHVSQAQLIRALDDELLPVEAVAVEKHLAACEKCKSAYRELGAFSVRLEGAIGSVTIPHWSNERDALRALMETQALGTRHGNSTGGWPRRAGWSLAIAAALGLLCMFVPHQPESPWGWSASEKAESRTASSEQGQTFQVGGESFIALPYSNTDLPIASSHIVEMQVPLASLADAGLTVEPVSAQVTNPDRNVLADVLLGADGEPLGVHVVGSE